MKQSEFLFKDYASFLNSHFDHKVQKLSIEGGFDCPNRDGLISHGGCTYCNNLAFTPRYCTPNDSIALQIKKGTDFFSRKYPDMKFLAYFQAHTNTYAPLETLKRKYEEALNQDNIVGLIVATRPDAIDKATLDYLGQLARQTFVMVEYGVESTDENVLKNVNRGHTFAQSQAAISETAMRSIHTCAHIILGLPGASHRQMLEEPALVSSLPIEILKLHQLQIVAHTQMAQQYEKNPSLFTHIFASPRDYALLAIEYIERLRPDLVIERFTSQSPDQMLIAPRWGMKNHEFVDMLKSLMRERHTWQGRLYTTGI